MTKRNFGIDFLRMVSMFMVVMLHVLGQGGILDNPQIGSYNYWTACFLETASYCAVNAFALISGYVMWHSKTTVSKISELWIHTFFYGALFAGIFFLAIPEAVELGVLIKIFFPITNNNYWYISAYFGLYLLIPLLNSAIQYINQKAYKTSLFSCFVLFSVIPTFLRNNPYSLANGYSMIWLCLMYLAGGYISKYKVAENTKASTGWLFFGCSILATWLSKIAIEYTPLNNFGIIKDENIFVNYTSPTIILAAIGIFIACSKLTFSTPINKLINVCSPAALGVYLIHTQDFVWDYVIKGFSAEFAKDSTIVMIGLIFLSAIIIYTACTIIDLLRIQLFKLLRIKKLCWKIENLITKAFNKLFGKALSETENT